MVNLTKRGSTLIVKSDQAFPWEKGEITLPMNSLYFVIDESDAIVFKSIANGDIIFNSLLKDLQINGTQATKDNLVQLFDSVGNAPSGGGSGTGAVDSVNGQTGTVVLTANDVNAYSKQEIDDKGYLTAVPDNYATDDEVTAAVADKVTKNEMDIAIQSVEGMIPDISNLATKNELNIGLEAKADKTAIADMATQTWVSEQDYATNTLVDSKLDKNTYNEDKATFATKSEVNAKQNKLTAGDGISIEGDTINVTYKYDLFEIVETLPIENIDDNKIYLKLSESTGVNNKYIEYIHTNGEWEKIGEYTADVNLDGYAKETWVNQQGFLKEVPSEYVTDTELTAKNYATKDEIPSLTGYATEEWVNQQGYLTSIPENYVTDEELTLKDYATVDQLPDVSGKLDTSVYDKDKATFALKSEIPSIDGLAKESTVNEALALKADKSEITDMATMTWVNGEKFLKEVPSEYITETELADKNYATVDQLPDISSKQDTLVNQVNIKSINNQSLLGEGNITIEGGGSAISVDAELSTDSTNPVQNKVITTELNKKVESLELTQQEYDELPVKDPNIMYIITDAPEVALKSDLDNLATKDELNAKADASAIADMATQTWVNQQGYLTSIPENYVTDEELNLKNYATKDELPSVAGLASEEWVRQQNYLTSVPSEYITETELTDKNYATVSQLPDISGKQDTLVNQVNIKSINGQTLLGEGNIDIQGGGSAITVDAELSTVSENPVQNKVITTELNKKVESVVMTQEEYDQLVEKKDNVMYVISNAKKVATQEWVGQQGYLTSVPETYALKSDVETAVNDMATMTWVTEQINAAIAQVNEIITEINNKIV